MRSEKQRDEVYNRNKPYLENEETTEDLDVICEKCRCSRFFDVKEDPKNYDQCRGCCVMELWLSNEYGEWISNE